MSPITDSSPSWRDHDYPTAHDRFRQIFHGHWDTWSFDKLSPRDFERLCLWLVE